jgi:hypothetical protein
MPNVILIYTICQVLTYEREESIVFVQIKVCIIPFFQLPPPPQKKNCFHGQCMASELMEVDLMLARINEGHNVDNQIKNTI